jgi:hypothetical protein
MALPGVTVTVNDGGLRVPRPLIGTRVLLLGTTTSTDFSVNDPVVVTNVPLALQALREATGQTASGARLESELSLALAECLGGGAEFVEIVKIGTARGLMYTGYSPHARYVALSGAYDALKAHDTDIVVPVGAYAEDVIQNGAYDYTGSSMGVWTGSSEYSSDSFGRQLAQFCYDQTTNHNTTIGVIGVKPPLLSPAGGSPATGNNSFFELTDTGVYFGTPSVTTLNSWVDEYLPGLTKDGFNSRVNATWRNFLSGSTSSYLSAYLVSTNGWQARTAAGVGATDNLGNKVDVGQYVSIMACPYRSINGAVTKFAIEKSASGGNSSYNSSAAPSYAGLIASLDPHSGPTNKVIPGLIPSRKLSRAQVQTLVDRRLVTSIARARGFVVADGITAAYHVDDYTKSDFTQLTTLRITHAAIDQVRLAGEPFIGEANNPAHLHALEEAIEGGLRTMQLAGALNRYEFAITATPDQRVLGQLTVDLTIVPAFEIKEIKVNVSLAKS